MINKNLDKNSANRVEKCDDIAENGVQGILSKNERNTALFLTSEHLMKAGVEILKVSSEMSKIYFELGESILEEINLKDDKMSEDEIQNIMNDILNIKGTL